MDTQYTYTRAPLVSSRQYHIILTLSYFHCSSLRASYFHSSSLAHEVLRENSTCAYPPQLPHSFLPSYLLHFPWWAVLLGQPLPSLPPAQEPQLHRCRKNRCSEKTSLLQFLLLRSNLPPKFPAVSSRFDWSATCLTFRPLKKGVFRVSNKMGQFFARLRGGGDDNRRAQPSRVTEQDKAVLVGDFAVRE